MLTLCGTSLTQLQLITNTEDWAITVEYRSIPELAQLASVDRTHKKAHIILDVDNDTPAKVAYALTHELLELSHWDTWQLFTETLSHIPCPVTRVTLEQRMRLERDTRIEQSLKRLPFLWEDYAHYL
jgi:hypothetical protein